MFMSAPGLDFSKIDNPVELYLSPPNDAVLGLFMDIARADKIHFEGSIDNKGIDYLYTRNSKGEITLDGIFAGERIKEKGVIYPENKGIDMAGTIGQSKIESKITPAADGPEVSSIADNQYELFEKINFDLIKDNIEINGKSCNVAFWEKIERLASGAIETNGYIGEDIIKRKIEFVPPKGIHINGNIGSVVVDEWILLKYSA